jgi:polysaccharide biosynthesis protein PslG
MGLAAIAAIAAFAMGIGALAAGNAHASFYGLYYTPQHGENKDFGRLADANVKTVRWTMPWSNVEGSRGHFNWTLPDEVIGGLAAKGIQVLPVVYGSPAWISKQRTKPPLGSKDARQAWKDFLGEAVKRYGAGGSFWTNPLAYAKQHPGKAAQPVSAWQIWNEPNLPAYFHPRPSPGKYAKLLSLAHEAVKGADPSAKVIIAGMPGNAVGGIDAPKFYRRLYKEKGISKDFDAAALHPYGPFLPDVRHWIEKVRKVMKQHGDKQKPLWLTELAWGSDHPDRFGFNKGKAGQKRMLKRSFKMINHHRHAWDIRRLFWFQLRDPKSGNPHCSFCGSAGLLKHSGKKKPAWRAFKGFT